MLQPDKITVYLETVRQQIRWKKAQPVVLEELKNHIYDQRDAFLSEGCDEGTALDRAVAEMGDPVTVGEKLDRAHRPKPDWGILALTGVMLLSGLVFQFLAGPNPYGLWAFKKQLILACIAIPVMLAAYFTDFTILSRCPKAVFFSLCAAVITCCLFTGIINGRYVYAICPLLLVPTAFSGFVYSMRNKGYGGLILCGVVFMVPAFLSKLVPSLTVLFLLCVSCLIVLTSAVLKGWFNVRKRLAILILYVPTILVLSVQFLFMINATRRIQSILHPSLDPVGSGYIGTAVHNLLVNSRFIGEGLPLNGYGDYPVSLILPGLDTDFFLTYLTYKYGWIVFAAVIALLVAFIIRAFYVCKRQRNVLGFLASLAIISTFSVQFIVYVAANLGFSLLSPLSLPLISYGRQDLTANMLLIGFLLSIFRTGTLVKDKACTAAPYPGRFIQYDDGRIIINLKGSSAK